MGVKRTIFRIFVFNICLPFLDIVTDINLIYKLYSGAEVQYCDYDKYKLSGRPYEWLVRCRKDPADFCSSHSGFCKWGRPHMWYATALLIPFLLNYIICLITCLRRREIERYPNIALFFALVDLYPIYKAFLIICHVRTNQSEGEKEEKIFHQNVGLHETLEAVPTAFITTVIFFLAKRSLRDVGASSDLDVIMLSPTILHRIPGVDRPDAGYAEFLSGYVISIISASLGLAKGMKYGVVRPIGSDGAGDTWKFVLVFFASAGMLVFRGFAIAYTIEESVYGPHPHHHLAITLLLLFLPSFLLAIFSTLNFRDKSSFSILYRHPTLIIIPAVTCFSFSRFGFDQLESVRVKVVFSKKMSFANIVLTTVGFVSWVVYCYYEIKWWHPGGIIFGLPLLVISIIHTLLFLFLDKLSSCFSCCPTSEEQLSVYDPRDDKRFILQNGQLRDDTEDEETERVRELSLMTTADIKSMNMDFLLYPC